KGDDKFITTDYLQQCRRKSIVEAPNGWIKAVMGLRQFSMRGLDKVQAEWKLVCMALNLRRMAYL
ncbi:transposase, partial [Klebsiella pneumoniae]